MDAELFQKPLGKLAEVLAQKVLREAPGLISPGFVALDMHILLRQAMYTYDLLFYLNADDRREGDCYWRPAYSIVTFPLVRNMIDCLYNITSILQDPPSNGSLFRQSGFKAVYAALEKDEERYGARPEWQEWIQKRRDALDLSIRSSGLNPAEIQTVDKWLTLGSYLNRKGPGGTTTPHQQFLETLIYGNWRQYSAMAHGVFDGLLDLAVYFTADSQSHEQREKMDEDHPRIMSLHLSRAAAILLCIVTELQAYFKFEDSGARINERICEMWRVLMPSFDVEELYSERYQKLMADKGIGQV
jgi:hypothetical protein